MNWTSDEQEALMKIFNIEDQGLPLDPEQSKLKNEILRQQALRYAAERDALYKVKETLDFLDIPHTSNNVDGKQLIEMLLDPKKFAILSSKINNKAFW